jgi:hypothetical protein
MTAPIGFGKRCAVGAYGHRCPLGAVTPCDRTLARHNPPLLPLSRGHTKIWAIPFNDALRSASRMMMLRGRPLSRWLLEGAVLASILVILAVYTYDYALLSHVKAPTTPVIGNLVS